MNVDVTNLKENFYLVFIRMAVLFASSHIFMCGV